MVLPFKCGYSVSRRASTALLYDMLGIGNHEQGWMNPVWTKPQIYTNQISGKYTRAWIWLKAEEGHVDTLYASLSDLIGDDPIFCTVQNDQGVWRRLQPPMSPKQLVPSPVSGWR